MNSVQTADRTRHELVIAVGVFFSCLGLIAVDKDTHGWSDLFHPGNIVALMIYFTPTYILTCLLYRAFAGKDMAARSILLSLAIGVPIGFALVILFFILVLA